jgi:peptidoglycan L-alanyl-D-glutamate endopeptidase CwlK
MPAFSQSSKKKLETCDPRLQLLFSQIVETFDCTIVEGHRPEDKQNEYYETGKSRLPWPKGKHNQLPSKAVDVGPFINGSVSWDPKHCLYFAGFVMGVATSLGIKLRWGGDWDMDYEAMTDQSFQDLVHFELVD